MLNVILLSCFISLFMLCLVVFYSNPKSKTNQSLAAFIVAGMIWLATNIMTNNQGVQDIENILLFSRATMVGASLLPLLFILFIHHYLGEGKLSKTKLTAYSLPAVLLITTANSDLNLALHDTSIVFGPMYYLLIAYFVVCFAIGIKKLVQRYNSAQDQAVQGQTKFIIIGVALSVMAGLFFNAIMPLLGYDEFSYYGSISVLIFALFTSGAIIRHQFLDIRLIVARSVAYLLSIALLLTAYVLISTYVPKYIFQDVNDGLVSGTINVLVLSAAVLLYQPQKRFFDKVTNSIFYRDAYDAQEFLDELNKTIISNIELGILLRHSARVIEKNLKCEYVTFSIFHRVDNGQQKARFIGSRQLTMAKSDLQVVEKSTRGFAKMISIDEQEVKNPSLYKLFTKHKIELFVRLAPSIDAEEAVGYMIFGPKKSGNRYSAQDKKIIEIIADELVIAIQNALRFEEIQNFSITLQEKVDDATRKLRRTNEKLKELDATKDDFISMASHQLRTPLTSVKGYLSMLVEGDVGKVAPKQQEMLEQAYVSSQRMTYLISDLLNVSRLKSGKFVIERLPTDLATVVEQEVAQLVQAAKARDLTLTYKKPANFPALMLDETKTRQIIMNFIDNAIYYTPQGGAIEVQVIDKPRSVEFLVTDTGLGVPKRDQPRLFTKFYRANNAKKARPDGTGLGLFMAKKVVIAQGGAVIFKSQEGKGSTFGFTFPKNKVLTGEDEAAISP